MGATRRSLGTSRPPQPQEGFGNLRCSWTSLLQPGLFTGWLRHGESRPGCRLAWDGTWSLDSGRWPVPISIPWKNPAATDTQYESFGCWGMLWPSQTLTWQGTKLICTSQWCPNALLVMAEEGPQPGDCAVCESQSSLSVVVILVHLKG